MPSQVIPRKQRRETRRAVRQDARRARHTARFMAAPTAQARMEAAWDHLRSVVSELGDGAAHEAADVIRRMAERLDKGPRNDH